jgi:hypothetical protein
MNYFQYLYELFWGNYKKVKLFTPDPKLVREEVNKRPFEPFGVPGMVSTVKPDDLISRPNLEERKQRYNESVAEMNDREVNNLRQGKRLDE